MECRFKIDFDCISGDASDFFLELIDVVDGTLIKDNNNSHIAVSVNNEEQVLKVLKIISKYTK